MSKKEKNNASEGVSQKAENDGGESAQKTADPVEELNRQIKLLVKNLYYSSETDAEINAFKGTTAATLTVGEVLNQTRNKPDAPVEQRDFNEFFDRLTKIEDWFGDEEKANAAKFAALKDLLARNLRDLAVYKIGKIQLDIYVVGLPAENILIGIRTKAVET